MRYEPGHGWTCSCGKTSFVMLTDKEDALDGLAKHVQEDHANEDLSGLTCHIVTEPMEVSDEDDDDFGDVYDDEDPLFE